MKKDDASSIFSALATYLLLALIAWKSAVFGTVINELHLLATGGFREISNNHTSFLMMFSTMIAIVVLELPCTMLAALIQKMVHGENGKHALTSTLAKMTEGNLFYTFFVIVLIEEVFARWLFLGLLPQIPFLSGTLAFYALFFIGNSLWALLHLANFKEEKDRKVLRVLPQFVAGIFFTYIFIKFGLLAVILTHFASNAIIFALHKIQRTGMIDACIVGYAALIAAISYSVMDKPLTDILPWFADNPVFSLPGWTFWDYVKISLFVTSCSSLIFGLLLYDKGNAGKKGITKATDFIAIAISLPIAVIVLYILYMIMGLFIANIPYRVLALAILLCFSQKGASGSAMSRTFWCGLPDTFIAICILQALGFWSAVCWMGIEALFAIPNLYLNSLDD